MDEVSIRKSEISKAVFESDCESLIKTLMKKEEKGDSYEFLEEIRALSTDLPSDRAKIIVTALLIAAPHLDTPSQKNFLSLPASTLAEHMVIELLDIIDPSNKLQFISSIISNANLSILQSVASVINMLELAYGRLAANGEERGYKKVITLEELVEVESIFSEKVKRILIEHSLFDFDTWQIVCYLMECFDPDYTKAYLETELKEDSNIAQYLSNSVTAWTGSGTEYEIMDAYKKYLTKERILQAIESLRQSGALFSMSEDIQRKCCAFYIDATIEGKNYHDIISEITVNELLSKWTQ